MSNAATAARVGVFALITSAAAWAIYNFIVRDAVQGKGYTVHVRMKDAAGIAKLSQVKIAGIPVGRIEKVALDPDGKARLSIRMREDVPLFTDSTAAKVSSSLLGEYYIQLAQGTEGKPKLKEGDLVPNVAEATTTGELFAAAGDIAKDVKKITGSLANSVGTKKGEEDIKKTLENLEQVTRDLKEAVKENRASLKNTFDNVERITARGAPRIEAILKNVEDATVDAKGLLAKADDGKKTGDIRQVIDKVNKATDKLDSALADVNVVTGRAARGEGTLGRLSKDEKLINDVEGVTEGVGELVGGIQRLQTLVALRTDYQFLSNTLKTYVSLKLQPREDKYYLIELVNDPKGRTRFEQVDVDTTNPNDPPHYREIRTVTTNSFRFSLQFAKRVGPFTGRFGILESTGGIGLDLNLLDDRFELRQDLFGFGEVLLPRWRASLGYEFIHRLWLLAGADDILSPDRRDYFFGVNLRFNDEDLKSILPFAPTAGL